MTREWWQQFSGASFEGTNGRYTLGELLGLGGFGAVFTASSSRIADPIAIKLIMPGADDFDSQFRELVRGLQIRHPSLVHCIDCGAVKLPQSRFLYMAMELAKGTLEDVLRNRTLPQEELIRLAQSIARGLSYLHVEQKLVHRDLKPANVLWVAGEWKLADYGVARSVDSKSAEYTTRVVGTVDYMPPESFNGQVSPAWDIWAFGVLLMQALTGRKPFGGATPMEIMSQIALSEPKTGELPAQWSGLIRSCLQRQPELRPTAAQVEVQLQAIANQPPPPPAAPEPAVPVVVPEPQSMPPSPEEGAAPARNRKWLWVAAALVLVVAAIAGGVYYVNTRLPSPESLTTAEAAYRIGYRVDLDISIHNREPSDSKLALAYYNRALELAKPDSSEDLKIVVDTRNSRASLYFYYGGDCAAVIEDYNFVLDHKQDLYAFINRGSCFERSNDLKKALQDFDSAVRMDPKSYHALVARANLLDRLTRKGEALADWERALPLAPEYAASEIKEKCNKLASELGRK